MKVLLVNGSPHQHGCTNRALQEIKKTLEQEGVEADIFWIENDPIRGCIACNMCLKNKKCIFDDVVNQFSNIAKFYDGFVFGSPTYYASSAGQMSAFMDRVFYSNMNAGSDIFTHKPVASVASCRRAGDVAALDQMNKYYGLANMFIVCSSYWNEVHGFTPKHVEKDEEGLQTMRNLGRNMAWFLKSVEAAKKAGVKEPEIETGQYTHFIR
ncbi:MAG: flavodoxin family protein [Eubacteriaceae bacterium]|uniref:Flavodoxin family protein n=1 Tax=Candidatus Pseudoramibacter fermentans TaxID=2594427 RepID=A0A6L5GPV1_9FIRM|nr:flavodoxin family protein [Candidatus Pseudoramibacter fermentans]RRF91992.1 MAG: flavodoxin family protein [Eubacteriaceae bacterium]